MRLGRRREGAFLPPPCESAMTGATGIVVAVSLLAEWRDAFMESMGQGDERSGLVILAVVKFMYPPGRPRNHATVPSYQSVLDPVVRRISPIMDGILVTSSAARGGPPRRACLFVSATISPDHHVGIDARVYSRGPFCAKDGLDIVDESTTAIQTPRPCRCRPPPLESSTQSPTDCPR